MLKTVFLVYGIVSMQFQYCFAEEEILMQNFKPGTIGRNDEDVQAVITGAKLVSNPRWINLHNAYITIAGRRGVKVPRRVEPADFEEGALFRYSFAKSGSFKIETCQLKVVQIVGFSTPTKQLGLTYSTANFTLYDRKGHSMGLVGNLGAPPILRENEFGVDMDDFKDQKVADVAMKFFEKIQYGFTSEFNVKLTGLETIKGVISGVTMRKNRQNKDYLIIEHKSKGSSGKDTKASVVVEKTAHPLYPEEKEFDVDLSQYKGKTVEEVARQFFAVIRGPLLDNVMQNANDPKELRITSVTMRKDCGKGSLVIGYEFGKSIA